MVIYLDDVVELNKRLIEQEGYGLCFESGICGRDFDLDGVKAIAKILNEIMSEKIV